MTPAHSGSGLEHRLVPDLRLRARVGEDQRGAARGDLLDHLRQHREAEVAAPRKALGTAGQQRIDDEFLGHLALHEHAVFMAQQRMHRLVQIAERGRHAPDGEAGFHRLSRASASCTCTPRLLPSSSCHSSTTTIFTGPALRSHRRGRAAARGFRAW
jgi:hypothetical protein